MAEDRQRSQQLPLDRFEAAANDFHLDVQQGFEALAAADPERFVRIDAGRAPAAVQADISAVALRRLAERRAAAAPGGEPR